MAQFNGLWLPASDSTNASPTEYDMNKVLNSSLVQAARTDNMFVGRMLQNATPLFNASGYVAYDADFTVTGGIGTETFQKNDRYTGMNINQIQRQVSLDKRPQRTGIEEESITRMFEQVNTRADVTNQLGYALASWDEVEAMKAIVDASQYTTSGSENTTEFLQGGNTVMSDAYTGTWSNLASGAAASEAKALEILDKLEDIAIIWGQTGVDAAGRYVILPPEDYWEIAKLEQCYTGATAIAGGIYGNMDIVGPKRDFSQFVNIGEPMAYRGFQIMGHNLFKASYNIHLAGLQSNHTPDPDHNNRGSAYSSGDLSKVQALVFQSACVGKSDVMSVNLEMGQVPMSANEYINAMTWVGYGTLLPQAAVVLDIA